ncbi:MAG: RdgB/HAM1 family non-canonical purine NTP pyrophosphatase [Spirochaetaceae bacterium]|nr:RdgB/HAM1 family non-canonical purine NTP pyrophosphatase [Spirochaetaceae bacterium]
MTLLLASTNAGKVREFRRVLPEVQVLTPADRGLPFAFEERGVTFLDNALGKARHLFATAGQAAVADDSGLVVPALGGAPGVRSARYGGDVTQVQRNLLLLDALAGAADRSARFVCCLAVMLAEQRLLVVQETIEGSITSAPRGTGGFGYDPIFQPVGAAETFAEMDGAAKDAVSHRGRALRRVRAVLLDSMSDAERTGRQG